MGEGIVLVVSSRYDDAAHDLVSKWPGQRALLLTAEDLSRPGWRCALPDDGALVGIVGERHLSKEQIAGVLTHWPRFLPVDLPDVHSRDRDFVAAEATAFLSWWLSNLSCPVLNRPSSVSLCGPVWRQEQWLAAGKSLGVPITSSFRSVSRSRLERADVPLGCHLTVVGDSCVGDAPATLCDYARALAKHADVELLDVYFYI